MGRLKYRPDFFSCAQCGGTFTTKTKLNHHTTTHLDRNFTCYICNMSFNRKVHLSDHIKRHTGEKPYICYKCNKCFTTMSNLKTHKKVHMKGLKCELCEKIYPYPYMLKKHMESHFTKTYECQYCNITLPSLQEYNDHVIVHEKQLLTRESNVRITKRQVLNQVNAISNVQGVEMYKCSICHKTFILSNYLKNHMEMHNSDVDSHKCKQCNITFDFIYLLKDHYSQTLCHNHFNFFTQKRTYRQMVHKYQQKLAQSRQKYRQKLVSKKIDRIKTGRSIRKSQFSISELKPKQDSNKSNKCFICKKSFLLASIFKIHEKRHAYENPFSCNKCEKSFDKLSDLDLHIKNFKHEKHENSKPECSGLPIKKEIADEPKLKSITQGVADEPESLCNQSERFDFTYPVKEEVTEEPKIEPFKEEEESKFTCGTCGEEFKFEYAYKRHGLTHTENKPHQCSCGASFMKATLLALHQVTHNHNAAVSSAASPAPTGKLTYRNVTVPLPGLPKSSGVSSVQENSLHLKKSELTMITKVSSPDKKLSSADKKLLNPDKKVRISTLPLPNLLESSSVSSVQENSFPMKNSKTKVDSFVQKLSRPDKKVSGDGTILNSRTKASVAIPIDSTVEDVFEKSESPKSESCINPRKRRTKKEMVEDKGKSFDCDLCGKLFTTRRYMIKHRQRHDHMETFKCDKCNQYFINWYVLETHEKTCNFNQPSASAIVQSSKNYIETFSSEVQGDVNLSSQNVTEQKVNVGSESSFDNSFIMIKAEPTDDCECDESEKTDREKVIKSEILDW